MALEQALPDDVMHMLCDELSLRNDFSTLYSLVVSSKRVAVSGAINALYRIAHECYSQANSDGSSAEDAPAAEARLITQKNSVLWRTIVLSALDKTSYPYCRHLRVLDLRDLGGLLQEDTFRSNQIFNHFFSGALAPFLITAQAKATRSNRPADRLRIKDTVAAMGDVVISKAPLLEAVTEHATETIFDSKLESWLPQLSHLRRLDVGDGRILAKESIRNLIHANCAGLSELRIFSFQDLSADTHLGALISGLPANTITLFENMSDCNIDKKTCEALAKHGGSLQTLSLALETDSMLAVAKLTGCSNLATLAIDWLRPKDDLFTTNKDECKAMAEWLGTCNKLEEVMFKNINFAPELLIPLLGTGVKLKSLAITGDQVLYDVRDHDAFHLCLAEQKSLEELTLNANAEEALFPQRAVVLQAICALTNLRKLRLTRLSEDFVSSDLLMISDSLLKLEDLYIGGIGYDDENLRSLSKLQYLKSLNIAGLSRFTKEGLTDFTLALGLGNEGMALQVDLAEFESALQPQDELFIAQTIAMSVGGTFRYNTSRDPNAPDYSDSDSD